MPPQNLTRFAENSALIPNRLLLPPSEDVQLIPTAIRMFAAVMLVPQEDDGTRVVTHSRLYELAGLGRSQATIGLAELVKAKEIQLQPKSPRGTFIITVLAGVKDDFTILPERVVGNASITSATLVVIAATLSYRNDKSGACFPGIAEIAKQIYASERAVIRHLTSARQAGLIKREQRGLKRSSQNYFSWLDADRFSTTAVVEDTSSVNTPTDADVPLTEPVRETVVEPHVPPARDHLEVLETLGVVKPAGSVPDDTFESVANVTDDTNENVEIVFSKLMANREKSGLGEIPDSRRERVAIAKLLRGTNVRRAFSVADLSAMLSYASAETKFFLPRTGGLPSLIDTVIRNEWLPDELHRKAISAKKSGTVVGAMFKGELVADNVDWDDPESHGWGGKL